MDENSGVFQGFLAGFCPGGRGMPEVGPLRVGMDVQAGFVLRDEAVWDGGQILRFLTQLEGIGRSWMIYRHRKC